MTNVMLSKSVLLFRNYENLMFLNEEIKSENVIVIAYF